MASPTENTGEIERRTILLNSLDAKVGSSQFRKLSLICCCIDLGGEKLDKAKSVSDLDRIIKSQKIINPNAILKLTLQYVGVEGSEALKASKDDLVQAEKHLLFPKLLVDLCQRLEEKDYDRFVKSMCTAVLCCHHEKISSREDLMKQLIQQNHVTQENVSVLSKWLKEVGRADLETKLIGKYKKESGLIEKEATEENTDQVDDRIPLNHIQDLPYLSSYEPLHFLYPNSPSDTSIPVLGHGSSQSNFNKPVEEEGGNGEELGSRSGSEGIFMQPGPSVHFLRDPNQESGNSQESKLVAPLNVKPVQELLKPNKQQEANTNETQQQDTHQYLLRKCCEKVVPILCLISTFAIVFASYLYVTGSTDSQTIAVSNDTIIAAKTVGGFLHIYTVTECLKDGDRSMHTNIYAVTTHSLLYHDTNIQQQASKDISTTQHSPSCTTGLIGKFPYLYLLPTSTIDYTICIKLLIVENVFNGDLFVFDSVETFLKYTKDESCKGTQATYSHNLLLGADGQFRCTHVEFNVTREGYYIIASKTPANISYYFNYKINRKHFNPTEIAERKCTVHGTSLSACSLTNLPRGTDIVIYVNSESNTSQSTTHVCLKSHMSTGFSIALAVLVGFVLIGIYVYFTYKTLELLSDVNMIICMYVVAVVYVHI